MRRLADKKIIIIAAALLLAGGILTSAHLVWAVDAPVAPTGGGALGKIKAFGIDVTSTLLAILGVLTVLQAILTQLLALVSFFLDNLFKFNTILLPNAMPVVHSGWTAMRDIANALFILILLWIAFTIIFNIENLGGKKLLARLIIIAILINFSLAMVSFVFGFANALAKPFQKAINTTDVAGLIVGKTNLHNITSQLNNSEKATLERYGINQEELDRTYIQPQEGMSSVNQQKFLPFALKPEEAKAEAGLTGGGSAVAAGAGGVGCGLGALLGGILGLGVATPVGAALGCAGGSIIAAIAQAAISTVVAAGIAIVSWKMILNLAVSNLFLILTIFALAAAGILLLGRIIAMVFVAVLAPTAFLAYTIPGKYGQKYWDMWLDNLLKWSFIAPAFYFLFWVSLLVLDKMQSTIPVTKDFSGNTLYIFTLIVFLGFLFASITIAKKMGITVADSFIKWGQKAGWGALGFAGGFIGGVGKRIAYPLAGRGAAALEKRIGGIESPFLRRALSLPATGLRKVTSIGREEVLSAQKKYAGMSTAEIQRALGQKAYITGAERTGMLLELTKRQAVAPLPGIRGYGTEQMRESVDQLKSVGADYLSILKASPSIAKLKDVLPEELTKVRNEELRKRGVTITDEEALQRVIWSKIGPADIAKLDFKIFDNVAGENKVRTTDGREIERGDFMKEIFLQTARPEHLTQLGKASPAAAAKIQEYLKTDEGKKIIPIMEAGTYNYFSSNIAGELGWKLPQEHTKPLYAQEEEKLRTAFEQQKIVVENASREFGSATRNLEQFDREVKRLADSQKDLETKSRLLGERLTDLQGQLDVLPPAPGERTRIQREIDYTHTQKERMEGIDLKVIRERIQVLDVGTKRPEFEKKVNDAKQEMSESQEKLNKLKEQLT